MKKLMITFVQLLIGLIASAQGLELTESGAYELKDVVNVDGTSASILYDRAMIALVDWTGPDGKAKAGIDYQSQETHTVIYKGTFYLGAKNLALGSSVDRFADFTLKVRCKDGRAQVTVTVPTVTAVASVNGRRQTYTVEQLQKMVNEANGKSRSRGEVLMTNLKQIADGIMSSMIARLKGEGPGADDDDF